MKWWVVAGVIALALVVQTTVFPYLEILRVKPDFILILAVCFGMLRGPRDGALIGLAGGLVEDILLGRYIGVQAVARLLPGYLAGIAGSKLYRENVLVSMVTVFGATVVSELLAALLWLRLGANLDLWAGLRSIILPAGLYNSILTPFIYKQVYRYRTQEDLGVPTRAV